MNTIILFLTPYFLLSKPNSSTIYDFMNASMILFLTNYFIQSLQIIWNSRKVGVALYYSSKNPNLVYIIYYGHTLLYCSPTHGCSDVRGWVALRTPEGYPCNCVGKSEDRLWYSEQRGVSTDRYMRF